MQDQFWTLIKSINGYLWGTWTLYILLATGLLFTIWTRFIQYRVLTHGTQVIRGRYDNPGDPGAISHFQALSAALSATIGLGNIGGVAIAISVGGPGAVFWMWVVGLLGMALKSVEITLAMMFRNTDEPDNPHGGAMWVIDKTLGAKGRGWMVVAKILGGLFAVTTIIMTFAGGNMFQTWNVADLTLNYFNIPKIVTGIVIAVLVGLVIVGGIKRIGRVAGRLVPVMCALYLLSGLAVLAVNIERIPEMFALIFTSAFAPTEAGGAFLGASFGFAFAWGLKRACFSNEAGLGSAPMAHAAAKTSEPAREGVIGGMGPFVDTLIVCTLTALVILVTGAWNREPLGEFKGDLVIVMTDDGSWQADGPTDVGVLPAPVEAERWLPGWEFFVRGNLPDSAPGPLAGMPIRALGRIDAVGAADARVRQGGEQRIKWGKADLAGHVPDAVRAGDRFVVEHFGAYRKYTGATLTGAAFDRAFPGLGKWMVTAAAWLFAISSMISWSYYGEQGAIYLLGDRAVLPYKLIFLVLAVVGAFLVSTAEELGHLQDFGTGGMLLTNLVIVLMMSSLAVRCLRDYFERLDRGEFHPHRAPKITDVVEGKDVE